MAPRGIIPPYRELPKPYKMPTVKEFLQTKTPYDAKKKPVWVTLEREMRKNANKKPYNHKVGIWLKFLKELKLYQHCEEKRILREIDDECGPPWFLQFSSLQQKMLKELPIRINADIMIDRPVLVRDALEKLGITLKIPHVIIYNTMTTCHRDPGIFIWNLYTAIYQKPPSVLRESYDLNAKILMSSLVCIDVDECIKTFNQLTRVPSPERQPKPKKNKKLKNDKLKSAMKASTRNNMKPVNVKEDPYAVYLQELTAPIVDFGEAPKPKGPKKVDYLFKLRSEKSNERLRMSTTFLQKRIDRTKKPLHETRICTYRFAGPRLTLKGVDPKKIKLLLALKMWGMTARMRVKYQAARTKVWIGAVACTGHKPRYLITSVSMIPTEYSHVTTGYYMIVSPDGLIEYIPIISGYWKKVPPSAKPLKRCEKYCNCLEIWEKPVINHLKETECTCGHYYNVKCKRVKMYRKPEFRHFQPPTRYGPHWFDQNSIFTPDGRDDLVHYGILDAVDSASTAPTETLPTVRAEDLDNFGILQVLLADLALSPLIMPHLPKANYLNCLHAWCRKRLYGKLTPEQHRTLWMQSQRRWQQLSNIDFRARAFQILFTQENLNHFNWSHREKLQKLFNILLNDFTIRNKKMQLEEARLWWSTMKYDDYPSNAFLDTYFTLLPGRMQDMHFLDPFCANDRPQLTPLHVREPNFT